MPNIDQAQSPLYANAYRRESFMQGGRPISSASGSLVLFDDGSCQSDGALQAGSWAVDDCYLILMDRQGTELARYCRYADTVTELYGEHLFSYGSVLVPESVQFDVGIRPIDDNPDESLSSHLASCHPNCRRILSRASSDYFDLFPRRGSYIEVGVGYGNYSSKLRESLDPAELHLVDCWRFLAGTSDRYTQANLDEGYSETRRKFDGDERVAIHRGLCQEVLPTLPRDHFDMVYIDANHTEEGCYADLMASEPLVRSDGFLCGHDYTAFPNQRDDVVERQSYGVIEAVDRFCRERGWWMSHLTIEVHGWCFPSFVLRRLG